MCAGCVSGSTLLCRMGVCTYVWTNVPQKHLTQITELESGCNIPTYRVVNHNRDQNLRFRITRVCKKKDPGLKSRFELRPIRLRNQHIFWNWYWFLHTDTAKRWLLNLSLFLMFIYSQTAIKIWQNLSVGLFFAR